MRAALTLFPFLAGLVIATMLMFVFLCGPRMLQLSAPWWALVLAFAAALGASALLVRVLYMPSWRRRMELLEPVEPGSEIVLIDRKSLHAARVLADAPAAASTEAQPPAPASATSEIAIELPAPSTTASFSLDPEGDAPPAQVRSAAAVSDAGASSGEADGAPVRKLSVVDHVERLFIPLMAMSAATVAFAHGGNDVGNTVGPFTVILQYQMGRDLNDPMATPWYVSLLGGLGIVVGLSTWGYRCMHTVGDRITKLTYSKGFCAQLGAAVSVLIATMLGLPVSTTAVLVGSVAGVGMVEGRSGVSLSLLGRILASWVVTLPAAGLLCVGIFEVAWLIVGS